MYEISVAVFGWTALQRLRRQIQELRDLTRTRKQLVREISQHSSRIQKVLEDANIKLGSVLSDVLGKSGRAMLQALIDARTFSKSGGVLARQRNPVLPLIAIAANGCLTS